MKKILDCLGVTVLAFTSLLGAGTVFAADTAITPDPATTQTPFQAELQLPENGGTNPLPPNPSTDSSTPDPTNSGNKPNNSTSAFAITYQPDIFAVTPTKLQESGLQFINVTMPQNSGTFDVGVKDKTRNTKGWTLKAQLTGAIASQPGITIETSNSTGEVKINNNGTLQSLNDNQVTEATNVSISSD